jgi:hypothetical protein
MLRTNSNDHLEIPQWPVFLRVGGEYDYFTILETGATPS